MKETQKPIEERVQAERIRKQPPIVDPGTTVQEVPMVGLLKSHEVQVLLKAGLSQKKTISISEVSVRTTRRITIEGAVQDLEEERERQRRPGEHGHGPGHEERAQGAGRRLRHAGRGAAAGHDQQRVHTSRSSHQGAAV